MSAVRKQFARNLKRIRKRRGLSQEVLAERLDISVRYVQQLEGKNTPNVKLDTLANLAKVLKVSPGDFLR